MKRFFLSAILSMLAGAALAVDIQPKAAAPAPAPAPVCTQAAGCTGWYVYGGLGGTGSNVDILGSGLGGSVFANGAELIGGGGYQLWNGQFFLAFEGGGGWLIPASSQAVALSSRWEGETLVKAGYGLPGLELLYVNALAAGLALEPKAPYLPGALVQHVSHNNASLRPLDMRVAKPTRPARRVGLRSRRLLTW
jgi:hypothetical protein